MMALLGAVDVPESERIAACQPPSEDFKVGCAKPMVLAALATD